MPLMPSHMSYVSLVAAAAPAAELTVQQQPHHGTAHQYSMRLHAHLMRLHISCMVISEAMAAGIHSIQSLTCKDPPLPALVQVDAIRA